MVIVPGAHAVKVEALAYRVHDLSKNSAHESLVVHVYWAETRDLLLLLNQLGGVLLVDQMLGLLFHSKQDDLGQLFVPNLLTVNVQEVLNILDCTL